MRDQRGKSNNATVTVGVIRNRFLPQFTDQPYRLALSENTVVGQSVFQVTAVDQDQVVSAHSYFLFILSMSLHKI